LPIKISLSSYVPKNETLLLFEPNITLYLIINNMKAKYYKASFLNIVNIE